MQFFILLTYFAYLRWKHKWAFLITCRPSVRLSVNFSWKLGIKHPWVMGIKVCSMKGHALFQEEISTNECKYSISTKLQTRHQSTLWWRGLMVKKIWIIQLSKRRWSFFLSNSTFWYNHIVFIDLKWFLSWAMWSVGILFCKFYTF